ncbi:MAG: hypothetical protein ACYDEO_29410 [Aggregatilineales bacterium]
MDDQTTILNSIADILAKEEVYSRPELIALLPDAVRLYSSIFALLESTDQIRLSTGPLQLLVAQLENTGGQTTILASIANIFSRVNVDSRSKLTELLPHAARVYPLIFNLLPPVEQVKTTWDEQLNCSSFWSLMSQKAKLLTIYRVVKENLTLPINQLNETNPIVKYALLILWVRDHPDQAMEAFHKAHDLLQSYIIEVAWLSESPLDVNSLLPPCLPEKVDYCEGRKWDKVDKRTRKRSKTVFCPRLGGECTPFDGARIAADTSFDWEDWSLLELLAAAHIQPDLRELRSPEEYVPKLSGWINRLNEIRSRLKCSKCGEIMRPNYAYAKNLARYNMTIVTCGKGRDHDRDIYLNHCWGCEAQIIDSRESPFRVHNYGAKLIDPEPVFSIERAHPNGSVSQTKFYKRASDENDLIEVKIGDPNALQLKGYYLCLRCGSGPQDDGVYKHGDICPKCGNPNMQHEKENERSFSCSSCGHQIYAPTNEKLQRMRERKDRNEW